VLVLVALFLATLTTACRDACPKPRYKVTKPSPGQRVGADQKVKIRFDFKNPFNATIDNYVIRMAIPIDKITYEMYNVLGHTAIKKAMTTFATEPDGSLIAWTLYNMPAGATFKFLVFVTVRDCAALGITSFPISSYLDVDGVPLCPIEGPAPSLRIVMPKKSKRKVALPRLLDVLLLLLPLRCSEQGLLVECE